MVHGGGPRQVKLDRESELRIEVGYDAPLKLRLLSGTAEIFGTELPQDFWLTFPPRLKFAVFTWNGATVEMEGSTETEYTADETPNISYVNVHAVLEERRHRAKPLLPDDPNSQINANLSICFKKCHSSPTYRHVAAGCTPADTCPNPSRPRRQTPRKRGPGSRRPGTPGTLW